MLILVAYKATNVRERSWTTQVSTADG